MFKTALNMLAGALIAAGVSAAFAVVGTPPVGGPGLVDATWLNGIVAGQNFTFQSGFVAHAGGTQAACLSLPAGISFMSVDTVATTGDSVCLPLAAAGMNIQIANNGANTLSVFGLATINPLTGAADTINNVAGSTAFQPTTQQNVECFVAKNGAWRCSKV